MIPQSQPKKRKNSSKANLIISTIFHAILVGLLFYFAARSGILGKKVQTITTTLIHEKKPEVPKPKPEPPKEPPKEVPKELPKVVEAPRTPPPSTAPPVVAPPPAEVPSFTFDGGKTVESSSDPVQLYKGYMEYVLRSKWDRPDNMDDGKYVAEVAVNVDKAGDINEAKWLKGSGNAKWDQSVRDVFKEVSNIGRPPPTNFPPAVTIRFDVQEEDVPLMTQ
jgi:outer membrane biosynthesis protein TonB